MAERLKAPVLKTGDGLSRPWVQIPPSPPNKKALLARAFLFADRDGCWRHAGSKHRRERCLTGSRDVTLARRVEGMDARNKSHPLRQIKRPSLARAFFICGLQVTCSSAEHLRVRNRVPSRYFLPVVVVIFPWVLSIPIKRFLWWIFREYPGEDMFEADRSRHVY